MTWRLVALALLAVPACSSSGGGGAACGLAAVAGATALLNEFGVPQQTLSAAPQQLPPRVVVRFVAGAARPAVTGRVDGAWTIGVDGRVPDSIRPGFAVLVLDAANAPLGVMIYEGIPVEGAPEIGTLTVDTLTVPLLGIRVDPQRFEDPRCPFFPDSVIA